MYPVVLGFRCYSIRVSLEELRISTNPLAPGNLERPTPELRRAEDCGRVLERKRPRSFLNVALILCRQLEALCGRERIRGGGAGARSRNPERSLRGISPASLVLARWGGSDLLSHTLSRAVQSARRGLTSEFTILSIPINQNHSEAPRYNHISEG